MNGDALIFDTDIPAATLAEDISVDAGCRRGYCWKGRNYQVNGTGDVLIDVPKPWNDLANNLDDARCWNDGSRISVQLVKAQTDATGGSLTLRITGRRGGSGQNVTHCAKRNGGRRG
ncbi:MAG: hypothetical protein ACLT78_05680 [Escherichia coli]